MGKSGFGGCWENGTCQTALCQLKFGGGGIIWGFSRFGLGPLVPVKGSLNASAFYQDIFDNAMLTLWTQFGEGPFLFHHDCAPVHKATSMKTWLEEFGVEELYSFFFCSSTFLFSSLNILFLCFSCLIPQFLQYSATYLFDHMTDTLSLLPTSLNNPILITCHSQR